MPDATTPVRWRVFDQALTDARSRFADVPTEELEALIDEAVAAVRKDHAPAVG